MKFDDLEDRMRTYESAMDLAVVPGMHMVARIDGRGFTKLTKESGKFEVPYDLRFRNAMLDTTRHLMQCGFQVAYGYAQSDEISLLFSLGENAFGRKLRKYNSVLAGEASARFTLAIGDMAAFDCRLIALPSDTLVVDYFRWRNEDAHRNCLSMHCYWMLRGQGLTAIQATKRIDGLSIAEKNELLFQNGTNFNDLPAWQKRGVGLHWGEVEKEGYNPKTQKQVTVTRRAIVQVEELPLGEAYSKFIQERIGEAKGEER